MKPIPNHPFYYATDSGDIYSQRLYRFRKDLSKAPIYKMRLCVSTHGYLVVRLSNGRAKTLIVHRLICETFHGSPPSISSQCRHLDGNRLNNKASNLKWGSALDNVLIDGRKNHKLDVAKVLAIRRELMKGVPRIVIARHYGIDRAMLHCLAYGKTWKLADCIPDGFEDWQAMKLMPLSAGRPYDAAS